MTSQVGGDLHDSRDDGGLRGEGKGDGPWGSGWVEVAERRLGRGDRVKFVVKRTHCTWCQTILYHLEGPVFGTGQVKVRGSRTLCHP